MHKAFTGLYPIGALGQVVIVIWIDPTLNIDLVRQTNMSILAEQ